MDGTLLDFDSYSHKGAENALKEIQKQRIPLVFCSSKTRLEQSFYQTKLGVEHPFIVENGGAVFIRNGHLNQAFAAACQIVEIGVPYKEIREKLIAIRNSFGFIGYGDMTVDEVSELTGLDFEASKRAMARDYSETIHFTDSAEQLRRFEEILTAEGLRCSHGGRFLTVTSENNDKGKAVKILRNFYQKVFGAIKTVGIGDAMNDLPLLAEVDLPILFTGSEPKLQDLNLPNLRKVPGGGPKVWGRIVTEILEAGTAG